jgi:hypothetical protein
MKDKLTTSSGASAMTGVPAWAIYGPFLGLVVLAVVFGLGMFLGKR